MNALRRPVTLAILVLVAAFLVALPVLGADPSPSAGAPGQTKEKADKGPELALTLSGTVLRTTDEKGRATFTMTVGGTTWELSAGPKWFWGNANPLSAYAGKSVEVAGTYHQGETDLDVETVNGTAIRAAGKPPWAGGPKVVGERHPGWKPWKASGKPGNGLGRAGAPGQNKDKTTAD